MCSSESLPLIINTLAGDVFFNLEELKHSGGVSGNVMIQSREPEVTMYPRFTFILQYEVRTELECILNQVTNLRWLP